jgi:hypothetical protein
MVSKKEVRRQLKHIGFKHNGWGRAEVLELPKILLPKEEIYECVNGMYEGGFALLVATDTRLLLVDKKPLNFLTVEDLRFDMISELDYNHRLLGAEIGIAAGSKNLRFRSYNQQRLRKLIGHVQHCIAESKNKQSSHQDDQVSHLKQINDQLQTYLAAQQQYQEHLRLLAASASENSSAQKLEVPEPPKPTGQLSDYLYAQGLLAQHEASQKQEAEIAAAQTEKANPQESETQQKPVEAQEPTAKTASMPVLEDGVQEDQLNDIYKAGFSEIFGSSDENKSGTYSATVNQSSNTANRNIALQKLNNHGSIEVNPLQIAYSRLPIALRSRKFGRHLNANTKNPTPSLNKA